MIAKAETPTTRRKDFVTEAEFLKALARIVELEAGGGGGGLGELDGGDSTAVFTLDFDGGDST